MTFIKHDVNDCGTPITEFKCETCGEKFTICPKQEERHFNQWHHCIMEWCESYDPLRDADSLFMTDAEIREKKKIVSIEMLRARKKGITGIESV